MGGELYIPPTRYIGGHLLGFVHYLETKLNNAEDNRKKSDYMIKQARIEVNNRKKSD